MIKVLTTHEKIENWKNDGKIAELQCPNLLGSQKIKDSHTHIRSTLYRL